MKDKNKLVTRFTDDRLEVSFPIDKETDYELNLELWLPVNTSKTKCTALLDKIEIILEKTKEEVFWDKLSIDEQPLNCREKKSNVYDDKSETLSIASSMRSTKSIM